MPPALTKNRATPTPAIPDTQSDSQPGCAPSSLGIGSIPGEDRADHRQGWRTSRTETILVLNLVPFSAAFGQNVYLCSRKTNVERFEQLATTQKNAKQYTHTHLSVIFSSRAQDVTKKAARSFPVFY
jgi:hypothetical protein